MSKLSSSMLFPCMLLLALGAPSATAAPESERWAIWDQRDNDAKISFDHAPWQRWLDEYLMVGSDGVHRVRYASVSSQGKATLQAYLATAAAVDPREFSADEQMAYWVNLYNALTVSVVLDNPGKRSILKMGGGWLPTGPWDDEVLTVAGIPLTLNDIEHRILRPIWQDHRIHFVVNCASFSCPNLAPDAFTASTLEAQLAAAEASYINDLRGVSKMNGRLQLSSIFGWYRDDFADSEAALLSYLQQHHSDLSRWLEDDPELAERVRYDYDWSLNSAP